jgi:hypothetical protein
MNAASSPTNFERNLEFGDHAETREKKEPEQELGLSDKSYKEELEEEEATSIDLELKMAK